MSLDDELAAPGSRVGVAPPYRTLHEIDTEMSRLLTVLAGLHQSDRIAELRALVDRLLDERNAVTHRAQPEEPLPPGPGEAVTTRRT